MRKTIGRLTTMHVVVATLVLLGVFGRAPRADDTGFASRKPVLAAACKVCPWGAAAEILKQAAQPYGWDIQICYNCWRADNPKLVAGAGMPPRVVLPPYIPPSQVPPPPNGRVDFGVTSVQNVFNAYHGSGAFTADGPRSNLRLIANIQAPNYLIVAVKASLGVTDLRALWEKRRPVRIVAGSGDVDGVLAYYGLTRQAIESSGGHIGNGNDPEERKNFDVVIAGGSLGNAPEYNVWYEVSQKFDLVYPQLPDDLLAQLAKDPTFQREVIPNGLLRGIDHPIKTVARTGIMIYSRADAPEDFAYAIAKAMDEHQDLLQWGHLNLSYNARTVWKALDIPLHPGAARYYREQRYMK
ncbi:MAG: TAXI family TRAP transporter solute-binding subunit [Acidobacteriia bacterium]|nr:TAXI family TRAP transporter solute-binding subunit [Terriglobia bacterium]